MLRDFYKPAMWVGVISWLFLALPMPPGKHSTHWKEAGITQPDAGGVLLLLAVLTLIFAFVPENGWRQKKLTDFISTPPAPTHWAFATRATVGGIGLIQLALVFAIPSQYHRLTCVVWFTLLALGGAALAYGPELVKKLFGSRTD